MTNERGGEVKCSVQVDHLDSQWQQQGVEKSLHLTPLCTTEGSGVRAGQGSLWKKKKKKNYGAKAQ